MGYQEFDELGEKIQHIIDSAVDEKNYQKLSQTISQTVNKAIDNGSDALKDALNHTFGTGDQQSSQHRSYTNYRTEGSQMDYRQGKNWSFRSQQSQAKREKNPQKVQEQTSLKLYGGTAGERVKGVLMTVFGGILTGTMGIGFLSSLTAFGLAGIGSGAGTVLAVSSGFLGIAAAAGGVLLGNGCTRLARLKRLQKYIDALGQHTYCNFQQLSYAVGKPVKYVKKDIKKMISRGWFLEGHVDKQETCLITSNETYDQYVATQKQLEERDARAKEEKNQKISPQVQEVLDKGNEFLRTIRESNDAIPGEEISRKISRMELIIQKIFERAKAHPEIIPDLNRLMDYYLPMTVKLLDAYEDMDSQPVQGENIASSKREIEETIDTLNVAFEKLLDSVFEDTAMDVSSDISVLHTVLAQEGLTENEFDKIRKEAAAREKTY